MSNNTNCQSCPSKSVGLVRGNLSFRFGAELPIKGGSLDLRLHYNSIDPDDLPDAQQSHMLAPRWASPFTRNVATSGGDAVLVNAAGGTRKYEYDSQAETLTPPPNMYDTLAWADEDPDLLIETSHDRSKTHYRNDPQSVYAFDAQLESTADKNGNLTYYEYDANGLLTHALDPDQRAVYFEYNVDDKIGAVQDWAGRTTYLDYDGDGNLDTVIGPEQCVNYFHYDDESRVTVHIDPEGYVSYLDYDDTGRVTRDALLGVGATEYQYGTGMTRVTDANGNATNYNYVNREPDPSTIVDALGNVTYHEYVAGRRVRSIDAKGNETYYT